jgi:hypothetical protein
MANETKAIVVVFEDLKEEVQQQVRDFLGEPVDSKTRVGEFRLVPKDTKETT